MVNFGPLAAEIGSVVWGTQANFNGFRVLASLLHGIRAVGVSQTFFSIFYLSIFFLSSPNLSGRIVYVYHTPTHGVALVRI